MPYPRDLLITLAFAGGSADLANLHNDEHTIQSYTEALESQEYKDFTEKLNKEFIENADMRILGNLYRIEQALSILPVDDKNFPNVLKAYTELLKLTSPIVERMQKIRIESNLFEGLELVIDGVTNSDDKEV